MTHEQSSLTTARGKRRSTPTVYDIAEMVGLNASTVRPNCSEEGLNCITIG
jgi:hypothetical protein